MSNTVLGQMVSGRFYTVTFRKNDGSVRVINGRFGVTKYLKGVATKDVSDDYVTVWTRNGSRRFDACRNVRRDSIIEIKAQGYDVKMNKSSVYSRFIKA